MLFEVVVDANGFNDCCGGGGGGAAAEAAVLDLDAAMIRRRMYMRLIHPMTIRMTMRAAIPHTTPMTAALWRSNQDGEKGPSPLLLSGLV